jgi:hypothetical protein
MNRGKLRRYALRVVAAVSLGVGVVVIAGGIANAGTTPTTYGKVIQTHQSGTMTASETSWT